MDKFKNQIRRLIMRHSFNRRPSSAPFITGDSFRSLANCIYDETQKCIPEDIQDKSIVFVKSDMLHDFFTIIHPKIKTRYILISHNSDENIDQRYFKYLDNKIIHWFAQNCLLSDSRISPIPFGLDNLYFSYVGDTNYFKKIKHKNRKNPRPHKNRILYGFSVSTNPKERTLALEALKKLQVADQLKGHVPFHQYLPTLLKYKFVASPPGNGIDSPRQWQGLYFNVIPILKSNLNTEYFINLGLPILRVEDWNELINLSEKDLNDKYATIMKSCNLKAIWMDYWIKKINEYKLINNT